MAYVVAHAFNTLLGSSKPDSLRYARGLMLGMKVSVKAKAKKFLALPAFMALLMPRRGSKMANSLASVLIGTA